MLNAYLAYLISALVVCIAHLLHLKFYRTTLLYSILPHFFFLTYACNTKQVIKPYPEYSEFISFDTIEYGDERFDYCEDLVDIVFGITHDYDTLRVKVMPRYNCTSYDDHTWQD